MAEMCYRQGLVFDQIKNSGFGENIPEFFFRFIPVYSGCSGTFAKEIIVQYLKII
jgi:hypothetical protein